MNKATHHQICRCFTALTRLNVEEFSAPGLACKLHPDDPRSLYDEWALCALNPDHGDAILQRFKIEQARARAAAKAAAKRAAVLADAAANFNRTDVDGSGDLSLAELDLDGDGGVGLAEFEKASGV
jgi:hypothetical protein